MPSSDRTVSLPYDVDRERKRLVVSPREAELVRHVFSRFVQTGSATELTSELNLAGVTTKSWTAKSGNRHVGGPWNKMHVYRILNNPIYIGEVTHRGKHYPGEHEAIVPRPLWDKAHVILGNNYRARGVETRTKTPALLRGILRCAHCGCAMGPTYTKKRGRLYRYYLCVHASKNGNDSCPIRTLSAGEIETAVVDRLRDILRSPEMVAAAVRSAQEQMTQQVDQLSRRRRAFRPPFLACWRTLTCRSYWRPQHPVCAKTIAPTYSGGCESFSFPLTSVWHGTTRVGLCQLNDWEHSCLTSWPSLPRPQCRLPAMTLERCGSIPVGRSVAFAVLK